MFHLFRQGINQYTLAGRLFSAVPEKDGKYIIPRFGERRLKCNRKCFKGQKCDVCDTIAQIGKNLQNVGLVIRYKKEDKTNGEGSREQSDSNEKIDGSI